MLSLELPCFYGIELSSLRLVKMYDKPRLSWVARLSLASGRVSREFVEGRSARKPSDHGATDSRIFNLGNGIYEVHVANRYEDGARALIRVSGSDLVQITEEQAMEQLSSRGLKKPLPVDVLSAARGRIAYMLDRCPRACVSFSGGKDSTVLLHLVMEQAALRRRKVGVLFIDLEAQYGLTIEHVRKCYEMYAKWIEPYWVALPLHLRNAVSAYEPHWVCWDEPQRERWVRPQPAEAITNPAAFPFFRHAMEFEEFVEEFNLWYARGRLCAQFVGIRADESLNRFRTLMQRKGRFCGQQWTTHKGSSAYNAYPIYDWKTADIWRYTGKFGKPQNGLYDLMAKAGLTIHQQRICQPYGDDQRKGLWLYHLIEPETWWRVVARVSGANSGALYSQERGNINGVNKITKPEGHSWRSYAGVLLASMPPRTKEHYEDKIAVFLRWYASRGYQHGIPDEADPAEEASKKAPSWRRICKMLLRNDYWAKGLSFTQTQSGSYERYKEIMKRRREKWSTL